MIFKLELLPQNFHYDVLNPVYSGADVHVSIIKESVLHLGRVSTWITLLINRSESALQKMDFRNKTAGLFSALGHFLDGS